MNNYKAFKNIISYGRKSQSIKYATRSLGTSRVSINAEETAWESAKPFLEIPSLPMLPFVGTAWHYMPIIGQYRVHERHIFNKHKRKKLGDIVLDKFGPLYVVTCYTADDLQEVLKNEGKYPYVVNFTCIKAYRDMRRHWFSTNGIISVRDEEWYHLRSKTQNHLLKPQVSVDYLEPVQDVAEDLLKRIKGIRTRNHEVADLLTELCKYTLESFAFIGLDTRLGLLKGDLSPDCDAMRIKQSAADQLEGFQNLESIFGNIQYWKYFNTPSWKKFVDACDVYAEISFKYINQALLELERNEGNEEKKPTLIHKLKMQNELDIRDIMVVIADFLMAGIESTANCLGFLLYRLAKNPEKQERLYQEIIEKLPTKEMKITGKDFKEFPYLKACIKEALRLNPVVSGTARHLANDTVLSGYQVPAGTLVTVPYRELFNDEKHYKNPNEFIPERWIKKELKNPFAFVPFGFGPRSCLGRKIAELEIVCAVTEILRNYKLEYHYEDIGVKPLLVDTPDKELRLTFIER